MTTERLAADATRTPAKRPDLFRLSKILGHSHERTTLFYSHLLPSAVAEVADLVNIAPAVCRRRAS